MGFFRKKKAEKTEKVFSARELLEIMNTDAKKLPFEEGEELVGALPIYIGVRDHFDPTHSYSCSSVRDDIEEWRLGSFISTSRHLIFRQMNEDTSFRTLLKIPWENVYEVEVSGLKEKKMEFCTDAGSFEFKGWDNEGIYNFRKALLETIEFAKEREREREFPTIPVVSCSYCGRKNRADKEFCYNCGAPLE